MIAIGDELVNQRCRAGNGGQVKRLSISLENLCASDGGRRILSRLKGAKPCKC